MNVRLAGRGDAAPHGVGRPSAFADVASPASHDCIASPFRAIADFPELVSEPEIRHVEVAAGLIAAMREGVTDETIAVMREKPQHRAVAERKATNALVMHEHAEAQKACSGLVWEMCHHRHEHQQHAIFVRCEDGTRSVE